MPFVAKHCKNIPSKDPHFSKDVFELNQPIANFVTHDVYIDLPWIRNFKADLRTDVTHIAVTKTKVNVPGKIPFVCRSIWLCDRDGNVPDLPQAELHSDQADGPLEPVMAKLGIKLKRSLARHLQSTLRAGGGAYEVER
jgi:hypothetical protein